MTARLPSVVQTVTAAALLVAVAYAPHDALSLWRNARNGQATPRATRALGPALSVGILDPNAVVAARNVIPLQDTYYVAAGPHAPERTADAMSYVSSWATLNLLPRRQTPRIDEATWVIVYGASRDSLGVRVGRAHVLGPGVWVARVLR